MRTARFVITFASFASLGLFGCADDINVVGSESATSGDDGSTSTGPTTDPSAGSITDGSSSSSSSSGGGETDTDTDTAADGSSSGGDDTVCGDGVVEGDEVCDDGGESATCNDDCTAAACGDGVLNETAGEVCDGGGRSASCNADCTLAECGDGVVNAAAGETCDDGGETATCNIDCSTAMCGDGVLNATAGEACDDSGESAACNVDCTVASCGDGTVNATAGEDCDDANDVETDACLSTCVAASCGDGFVQEGVEECDAGNTDDLDGCSSTCESECAAGQIVCAEACIDPATDEAHCGGCDTACDPGQACIAEACVTGQVLVVGSAGLVTALQNAGYTVTSVTWNNAAASLDASIYPVAFIGRYAVDWTSMTPENIAAIEAYSAAGGNIVTEWDGASLFFSGYDATYRYAAGAVTPLAWYAGTVGGGYQRGTGTPITQTIADPLFTGVTDPFSAGSATEFFFTFQNVDETQLELLATFEGDGSADFPLGSLGTIYRGRRCGGNIIFASFDYQDQATNAGFGDLMGNFVEAALAPPSAATIDVCP